MDERINSITSQMSEIAADAKAAFGSLTVEQLNWKLSENSWSVAQCLDHIIKTNHEFDAEFEKLASGTRKNSFWESYSPFSGWAGNFLIGVIKNDAKKAKAPTQRIVPPSDVDAGIVDTLLNEIAEVNKKIEACAAADRQKTVVTSPFLKVFTYKLDDALTVLVEHSRRHVRQAKRVMAADGFPTGGSDQ